MPADIVIRAHGLGKHYRIGRAVDQTATIREALTNGARRIVTAPFNRNSAESRAREYWAIRDISVEVERGEVMGIVGRNGAGKSTLLKVFSRITEPSTGWAEVKGAVGSLLEVGSGFHPELTGRENVYLNGAVLGMRRSEIRRKFDEIVAFAEVERFLDTPIKRYSSGMHTRLAFAVAAHLDTSVLIVDEVLAVGDLAFQEKCLGKMRDAAHSGRTVLFVSHNMGAIATLCDRALLLEKGVMTMSGPTSEVLDAYYERFANPGQSGHIPRDMPRSFSTGEAWIDEVTIEDRDGQPTAQLFLGDRPRVRMTFEAMRDLREAVLEIDVISANGVTVTTSTTIDGGRRPLSLEPGVHTAELELDIVLTPGRYSLLLGIHHYNGATIDWVERAGDFTVLNLSKDGDDSFRWAPRGFVRPSSTWSVKPADVVAAATA